MDGYLSLEEAAKRMKAHPNIVQELVYSGYIRTVQTSDTLIPELLSMTRYQVNGQR